MVDGGANGDTDDDSDNSEDDKEEEEADPAFATRCTSVLDGLFRLYQTVEGVSKV